MHYKIQKINAAALFLFLKKKPGQANGYDTDGQFMYPFCYDTTTWSALLVIAGLFLDYGASEPVCIWTNI